MEPTIIQGGMGVGVSSWRLANTVARNGQLGVVSGTALDLVFARYLQQGDPDGHLRRALRHFPVPDMAQRVLDRYWIPGGKAADAPFRAKPVHTARVHTALQELTIVANFVEVWLAKEGHGGVVGINLLEKVQLPNLLSLYGAMLAGVDYVLMGAGIPLEIPGILDCLADHAPAALKLHVAGASADDDCTLRFVPQDLITEPLSPLKRPRFLAIIASVTLALTLLKRATGRVDGFVIEGPTAGGHNAPPRGPLQCDANGEPIYGQKDIVDLAKIKSLGVPFWLAGSYGHPEKVREALAQGASGVQVGTAFAFCRESGVAEEIKRTVIERALCGQVTVTTDPLASPTGYPFKVVSVPGSVADPEMYDARPRRCDLGYLRQIYMRADGALGYRCPAEPVEDYVRKGGKIEETVGRKCLCNGLMATIGLPQRDRQGSPEMPLVTAGDDLRDLAPFVSAGAPSYSATDVLRYLLTPIGEGIAAGVPPRSDA
ncbi:MAG: nitronate monooxygenase [Chloroflexota bacterium]|nr:nitronate monooxygenase [Chloroflexota bacterium]